MEYQTADESGTEYSECDNVDEESSSLAPNSERRKNSFVWTYFRPLEDSKQFECIICNGCVGNQTSNLARHLEASHDITKQRLGLQNGGRGRPSRSFIWKYCTKEDSKRAHCHLCDKYLYFGGGNTSNITKHLRRKHFDIINNSGDSMDETTQAISSINQSTEINGDLEASKNINTTNTIMSAERKERKGGSYVWNYCDKLSRHTIRCKLCNKVMSFHGTANVITHLQRKHNIVGKVDNDTRPIDTNAVVDTAALDANCTIEQLEESDGNSKSRRRSLGSMSYVWKYCTRIGRDVVRCGFCKKNLSYQGTSNLQRHLHRMHGVATQLRGSKISEEDIQCKEVNTDFIWQHCTMTDDDKAKCNMCNALFESKDTEEITKHLTITHSVVTRQTRVKRRKRRRDDSADDTSDEDFEDFNNDSWDKTEDMDTQHARELDELNIKKDDSLYDDIIEENADEDPFDPSMGQEVPLANPLSPQSSRDDSMGRVQPRYINSKNMQKLQEERVRMETEYFREKAGFYRMQKYLTALQAKKVRMELERVNGEFNGVAYTVDVGMPQNLPTN